MWEVRPLTFSKLCLCLHLQLCYRLDSSRRWKPINVNLNTVTYYSQEPMETTSGSVQLPYLAYSTGLFNGFSQIKLFLASFWSTFIRSLKFPAKWKQRSVCARIHSTVITKRRGKCYQNIGILFSGLRCMMTDLLKFIWYAKFAGKSISK